MWSPLFLTGFAITVLEDTEDWALDGLSIPDIWMLALLKSLFVTFLPFIATNFERFGFSSSSDEVRFEDEESELELKLFVSTCYPIPILPSLTACSNAF